MDVPVVSQKFWTQQWTMWSNDDVDKNIKSIELKTSDVSCVIPKDLNTTTMDNSGPWPNTLIKKFKSIDRIEDKLCFQCYPKSFEHNNGQWQRSLAKRFLSFASFLACLGS